jgi:hypothetical protein
MIRKKALITIAKFLINFYELIPNNLETVINVM